jgi:hypothetical protein
VIPEVAVVAGKVAEVAGNVALAEGVEQDEMVQVFTVTPQSASASVSAPVSASGSGSVAVSQAVAAQDIEAVTVAGTVTERE